MYLLTVLGAEVPEQDDIRVGFFSALSLWCIDGCHLPMSSNDLPSVCVCVQISPFCQVIGLDPTLMTSFNLNQLLKDPLSKCNHILQYWGAGLQHRNLRRHNSACNSKKGHNSVSWLFMLLRMALPSFCIQSKSWF